MKLQAALEQAWYKKESWVWLLAPLTLLFGFLSFFRRILYKLRLLKSAKPPVPIIVVGNISVGGNGKTPVVIAIAEFLSQQGHKVGVLSRGYKGTHTQFPHAVQLDDSSDTVGDEPFLIFNRLKCDVVIDPIRARGAQALYDRQCSVILCDDGLQHYALQRDIELVVMDSRQLGNGYLLPMGPLRERAWRLKTISMLICNGEFVYPDQGIAQVNMRLRPIEYVNLNDPSQKLSCDDFAKRFPKVFAACAIGNPDRFYATIRELGVKVSERRSFPDHHHYSPGDLPSEPVVMTEKDAVKCNQFAHHDWWYLKIEANLPEVFFDSITAQINRYNETKNER